MQALKALVAGLGLLIVVLTMALVWGLYQKAGNPEFKPLSGLFGSLSNPDTPSRAAFGTELGLPSGCRIADMVTTEGRLFLRIDGGADCDRVVAIDPSSGTVIGTIWSRR